MNRATRTNLLLLGVLAAVGAAIYLQIGREVARFEPPLSALDPASVRTIRVACLHCVARRFERVGEHWRMREPYDLPADDAQVERLLAIAGSAVRSRRPLTDFDAARIGLDPPQLQLQLDDLQLDFGSSDALNGDRYVRVGDSIAMVPDRFSPFLAAAPASELDRHLVPRDTVPTTLRVNGIERSDLLGAWTNARAARVRASAEVVGTAPAPVAELLMADGALIRFRLGHDGGALIARRDEPALDYALDEATAQALFADAEPAAR